MVWQEGIRFHGERVQSLYIAQDLTEQFNELLILKQGISLPGDAGHKIYPALNIQSAVTSYDAFAIFIMHYSTLCQPGRLGYYSSLAFVRSWFYEAFGK